MSANFFKAIFRDTEGIVCISSRASDSKVWVEEFFEYPSRLDAMLEYIEGLRFGHNVWFCSQVLDGPTRDKGHVKICPVIWADLDACHPDRLLVPPTIVVESSLNRYQAYWVLDEPLSPGEAEDIARKIAYAHVPDGADNSGWDLTQLLRVPGTHNYKYPTAPEVRVKKVSQTSYVPSDFDVYPEAKGYEYTSIPFPERLPVENADALLEKYRVGLHPQVWFLYGNQPEADWSASLWRLEMLLSEAGLPREEIFVIAKEARCNKFAHDDMLLWKDVCRASQKKESFEQPTVPEGHDLPPLLSDEERKWCEANTTIVEEYIQWAKTLGDAAWQYHEAGAFVILSSLLAGTVRLPTSFGLVVPNLWFMILADTTLTRKTTAMDVAMDVVLEIDSDTVLATDGTIEGLMTSLSMRPGRPSIFLRDEFSGLLEAITKKDYYAGMAETFTKLYDGKFQKRVLRKEILEVREPVLILFTGGIRTRVLELLTYEHVASGFIPRFVFVTAESDVAALRPLGPPTDNMREGRQAIVTKFGDIHKLYSVDRSVRVGETTITEPARFDAKLTPEAWSKYNIYETAMLESAISSPLKDILTPSFDRLSKSGLKAATLLGAAKGPREKYEVEVTETDVIRAFYYVERWRLHTLDVLDNVGKGRQERELARIHKMIRNKPGVQRSTVMQYFHLSARDAEHVLTTLEQRGLITRNRNGRAEILTAVG
jgi:hypothetical protein